MVHSQWPRPPLGLERCGTKWNYPECLSQTSINTSAEKPKDPFGPGPIPVLRPRFASGPLPRAQCTSGYNPPPQVMLRIYKTKFWKKKSCKTTWGGLITNGIFENVFCIICIRFGQILEMENVLQTWRWYLMLDQITKIKKAGKKPWLDQRNDKILEDWNLKYQCKNHSPVSVTTCPRRLTNFL